jgi:hypothetical protein
LLLLLLPLQVGKDREAQEFLSYLDKHPQVSSCCKHWVKHSLLQLLS